MEHCRPKWRGALQLPRDEEPPVALTAKGADIRLPVPVEVTGENERVALGVPACVPVWVAFIEPMTVRHEEAPVTLPGEGAHVGLLVAVEVTGENNLVAPGVPACVPACVRLGEPVTV